MSHCWMVFPSLPTYLFWLNHHTTPGSQKEKHVSIIHIYIYNIYIIYMIYVCIYVGIEIHTLYIYIYILYVVIYVQGKFHRDLVRHHQVRHDASLYAAKLITPLRWLISSKHSFILASRQIQTPKPMNHETPTLLEMLRTCRNHWCNFHWFCAFLDILRFPSKLLA